MSAIVSADIAAAFRITIRLRRTSVATTAKAPTPQARNSSDSYMLDAGIRPPTDQRMPMPQLITAKPAKSATPAATSRPRRGTFQAAMPSASDSRSTIQAVRVGRARL